MLDITLIMHVCFIHFFVVCVIECRLDYQPLFGKLSPHSSPKESLFGEDQRPDPGDGGNRAYIEWSTLNKINHRY